jgi:Tfp pilus assembly protein PilE
MKTNSPGNKKDTGGLTRVELLTLIVTIAVLGLLAVPAWSRPGPRPARAQCLANLRQMALATIQYANEYRNRLPQNTTGAWPTDLPVSAANTMQPFGLTKEILYEPGLQNKDTYTLWNFTPSYHVIGYVTTFAGAGTLLPANANASIDSQPSVFAGVWTPAPAPATRVL